MSRLLSSVSCGAVLMSMAALAAPLPASAADTTISTTTSAQRTVNAGNSDNLTVTATGTVTSNFDPAVRIQSGAGTSTITNAGTIESTGPGASRAIRFVNPVGTYNVTISNNVGGIIQSPGDAIQAQGNIASGTILIDNAGIIRSNGLDPNNGQAIDFANITAGTASVTLINRATGVIRAADADAIRAAQNMIVNNFGTIQSNIGSGANGNDSGNDAIDFQGRTGTVNNMVGGLISSARHGITGDLGIVVNNAGTIVGNDGSGINIDSSSNGSITTIVNTGTITGTALTADGDGIDIDRLVTLNNYGTIRGIGTGGGGNLSEGLAIGGGTVNNYAGGVIYGAQRAITVDDSSLGNAFAAITINNAGRIEGGTGDAIRITSTFNNALTNSGVITGSVAMGSGDDTVSINAGSQIVGLVNGGANTGAGDTLTYAKIGLTAAKIAALQAGQTVNVGGTLYTGFENFTGSVVRSFSSFASSGQTTGVASILDNGSNTQPASLAAQSLIDQVASAGDVNAALAQLTPTAFQGLATAGINSALQTAQTVDQRLSNVRDGALAFDVSNFEAVTAMLSGGGPRSLGDAVSAYSSAAGSTQNPAYAAMAKAAGVRNVTKAPPMVAPDSPWGLFLYGNAIFARQDATANSPQSKFTATGVTAGVDYRVTPDLVLGVLGGYTRTDADLDTLGGTSKINTWLLGAYGTYYRQNWFVNGAFVYGRNSYDNNRIALGTSNTSSPKGDQVAVQGSLGTDLYFGRWIVTPELGAQYTTVRIDGFTESGPAALAVEADRANSLRSSLGARLRYQWQSPWGVAMPELRASWQHEFLDKERDVRASFVDQTLPGTFATTAAGAGSDFGVVGAGMTANIAARTQASLGYDFKFGGHDFTAHQLSGRLRHTF